MWRARSATASLGTHLLRPAPQAAFPLCVRNLPAVEARGFATAKKGRVARRLRVLLLEDVEKVGSRGELVDVKPGYFRNFLQPRALASFATPENIARVGEPSAEAQAQKDEDTRKADAEKRLAKVVVTMRRKYMEETDAMHGPVRAQDIAAKLLKQHQILVKAEQVLLGEPLNDYGEHIVPIRGNEGTESLLKVTVQRW